MTLAPALEARHTSFACVQQEAIHSYVGSATLVVAYESSVVTQRVRPGAPVDWVKGIERGTDPLVDRTWARGVAVVQDTCDQDLDGDGIPFDYDGDTDLGVGGGRFIAGSDRTGCLVDPETPHHGYGVGAEYWADDETGLASVAYFAGADGPALIPDPTDPCATDGIISDDPVTNPGDCGAGAMGAYAPGTRLGWTPATLGETVQGNGACDPFDGTVWVHVALGAYANLDTSEVIVFSPISGHVWG